jgi:GNAT superfamily N-acetyltransferase
MTSIRRATLEDVPALRELIPLSARELSRGFYTAEETESAILHVFGPDSRLIADGTYFVVEDEDGRLAGCGGWSRRRTLFGGDQMKSGEEPLLDPATEAARVRAFFVHPDFARRGIGTRLLEECVESARSAGFRRLELAATLPGVPLYAARGFREVERIDVAMRDGRRLPIVRMEREIDAG